MIPRLSSWLASTTGAGDSTSRPQEPPCRPLLGQSFGSLFAQFPTFGGSTFCNIMYRRYYFFFFFFFFFFPSFFRLDFGCSSSSSVSAFGSWRRRRDWG